MKLPFFDPCFYSSVKALRYTIWFHRVFEFKNLPRAYLENSGSEFIEVTSLTDVPCMD